MDPDCCTACFFSHYQPLPPFPIQPPEGRMGSMDREQQLMICDTLLEEVERDSRILDCFRIDQTSSKWIKSYHDHAYLELLYFIRGKADIEGDHSRSFLGTNDLIIYPPHFGHKEHIDFSKHQEAFCLGVALREEFSLSEALTINDPDHELEWIFTQLHRQFLEGRMEIAEHLKLLLFQYIRISSQSGSTEQPLSIRIINYLEHHYQEKIYQEELSELVQVSSAYMYRVFRQETGHTPMDYLNRLRISKAQAFMSRNNWTLEELGSRVGIHDPKYFSKLFRKYTGVSYSTYRKQL